MQKLGAGIKHEYRIQLYTLYKCVFFETFTAQRRFVAKWLLHLVDVAKGATPYIPLKQLDFILFNIVY